ncbi:hypothetical protein [Tumebacillus flagellatus]|uniref:Lipoprotein n=1 Tax=Tumebacillus flagellatus TaxID=1157490 RepID=A0A074LJC9_9BACL|nr:hypothetical protein [Tumebacillus flagellatus]KEO82286.1 hypothetical protein EL26_16005 [Tumebacillus flagellatus]
MKTWFGSRSLQGAAVILLASSVLAGCGNQSGSSVNNAVDNAHTNTVPRLYTASNQLGLPGLTHGANLRSDRNIEARVNAIPGISTTSVLTTGNTAYVLLDAGSRTGKGSTGTGTTGTRSLGGHTSTMRGTSYNPTPGTGMAFNGPARARSTNTYGGTREIGAGRGGTTGASEGTGVRIDPPGLAGSNDRSSELTPTNPITPTTPKTGKVVTGRSGMGTSSANANTNAGSRNLPPVGISSTSSITTDMQTRIISTIRAANPVIQNIYFVTKVH